MSLDPKLHPVTIPCSSESQITNYKNLCSKTQAKLFTEFPFQHFPKFLNFASNRNLETITENTLSNSSHLHKFPQNLNNF